eukprot:4563573-Amphidinium_carterae.1
MPSNMFTQRPHPGSEVTLSSYCSFGAAALLELLRQDGEQVAMPVVFCKSTTAVMKGFAAKLIPLEDKTTGYACFDFRQFVQLHSTE